MEKKHQPSETPTTELLLFWQGTQWMDPMQVPQERFTRHLKGKLKPILLLANPKPIDEVPIITLLVEFHMAMEHWLQ